MMTNVVVVLSLGGLLVGCMLLTGTVVVEIISPSLLVGFRLLQSKEGVIVASSLLVNCVLLLTGTVTVVEGEVIPPVWGREVVPTVWGREVVPAVWGREVVPTVSREDVVPTVWGGHVPTVWEEEVVSTVWGGEVDFTVCEVGTIDAVEGKHTT